MSRPALAAGLLTAITLAGVSSEAVAAEAPYLDDRSTPQAVISSYYSAINRHEYARAYSYFGEAAAPPYDGWEAGYGDTTWVEVTFGEVATEGAAGSIYHTVPVRLDVQQTGGQHVRFAGCYVVRLAQPAIQAPPFEPMHIESADLKRIKGSAPGFAPADCTP